MNPVGEHFTFALNNEYCCELRNVILEFVNWTMTRMYPMSGQINLYMPSSILLGKANLDPLDRWRRQM